MAHSTPKSPKIDLKPVASSAIKAVGYHPQTGTLRLEFYSGGIYDYAGVTPEKHAALTAAESIGRHFLDHIRGKHDHTRFL